MDATAKDMLISFMIAVFIFGAYLDIKGKWGTIRYLWHVIMKEFHYRMCYVWNFPFHHRKWKYHNRRCFQIRNMDYPTWLND